MPSIINRKENVKSNFNGIEVTSKLLWQSWKPGAEFTKIITMKNVSIKTKKFKFKFVLTIK